VLANVRQGDACSGAIMPALVLRWLPLAVLLTVVGQAGCRSDPARAVLHTVSYRLEWSHEGIQLEPTGAGWWTTTDRGYRVHIERGYLVNYSMELVECPKEALASDAETQWAWFAVQPAWAGHAPTTPNPAAIYTPHIEALHAPTNFEVGSRLLAAQRYCRVHYLIARANRSAVGLPDDVDMVERSLYVRGTYQAAAAAAPRSFELATSAANAVLTELFPPDHFGAQGSAFVVDTGREDARVVIHRTLKSLFDGVDFDTMPPARIERQVLQNLIDHTDIAVHTSAND
jgi:hypothetical protein